MADEFSGALNQRVAIETWAEQRDDTGSDVGHWQLLGSSWAALEPDGAGGPAAEARRAHRRWRVTLRRNQPIGLTSRLIWQGQALAVLAVESDPRQPDRVVLRCEARSA